MANNPRIRRRPTILSRDLLNLAVVLAFLHVDPEAYFGGLNNIGDSHITNKVFDDLNALGGRLNGHFRFDQPVEISAYILNAETQFNNNNDSRITSAVNNTVQQDEQSQPQLQADDDSGVSDVDSGHQSGDEDNLSTFQASSSSSASPARLGELDETDWLFGSFLDNDEITIEDDALQEQQLVQQQQQQPNTGYEGFFDTDESSAIFRDLDDLLGSNDDIKMETEDFAPDEEDVENQLMHIDDQLIRLDENIEHISDHLDEQFLNTATSGGVLEADALLTQEEENFLFESMPEVMDPLHGWQLDDPSHQEIEELTAAGLPSPLLPSPFYTSEESRDSEKPKTSGGETVKQEPLEQLDDVMDYEWFQPVLDEPLSPADSLASSYLPHHLIKDEDLEDEAVAATSSHLVDHNYAMSSFDECFGRDAAEAANSFKTGLDLDFLGGATALSPTPSSMSSATQRESRDERKARELNLPFAVGDIIDLPIDGFNELLTHYTLTEAQLVLCRDIRRRGKNKVAAQNCRQRKMDLISELEDQVTRARHQKQVLIAEREELYRLRNEWTDKLLNLESAVLHGLNKNVEDFTLDYTGPSVRVTTRLAKPTKA